MGRCSRQAVVTMKKSHIMPASSQFPVQLWLLAARSSHCPQTPRCQLQSLSSDTPMPTPVTVLRHPDASSSQSSDTPMPAPVSVPRHPTASSSHCPQTSRCQLQSLSPDTPMPAPVTVPRHPDASSSQSPDIRMPAPVTLLRHPDASSSHSPQTSRC